MNSGHTVAAALLCSGDGDGLPVAAFFISTLAFEFEHAALRSDGGDAGHAQLGGFLDQPVHALIGGNAGQQMNGARGFALNRVVRIHLHLHIASAHARHSRLVLATFAIEQRDHTARL